MVVDDDRLLLEHLELILTEAGYSVTVCQDGEAALYLLPSLNLDVIILDSVMPGMDGPEVLRHLKSDKRSASIPVMMLTAKTGRDSVEQAVKLGAQDYLAKPVDPAKLRDRLTRLLEKSVKKSTDSTWEWKNPGQGFDLPLQRAGTRIILAPDNSTKK
jgi:DNA-binding response OmpR family regulator